MKTCRKVVGGLIVLACINGVPGPVLAGTSVYGRSSTVLEFYDSGQEETAVAAYQYLQLNMKDIASSGWNFRGYGRLADDLNDAVDIDSRLYYAYVQKRTESLDTKIGRQFLVTAAGASLMDGAMLASRGQKVVDFKVYGGGDVRYDAEYAANDLVFGGELSFPHLVKNLMPKVSYLRKYDAGDLSHEVIGLDLNYDWPKLIETYVDTQYSVLTEESTYFLIGAKYYRDPNWSLRADYLYSLPVFSATSIYSVFAVDEYQEFVLEYTRRLAVGLSLFGRYTHEFYTSTSDADVYELGIEKIRTDKLSGYVAVTYRQDDDGQDLQGIKVQAKYLVYTDLQVGAGAHVDVLERQIGFMEDQYGAVDDTTSQRYWVDMTYNFTRKTSVELKLESLKSDFWDHSYRGRARFNIIF